MHSTPSPCPHHKAADRGAMGSHRLRPLLPGRRGRGDGAHARCLADGNAIGSILKTARAFLVGSTEKNMKTIVEGLILTIFICMGLAWLASTPAQADEPSSPIKTLRDEFACPTHARRVAGQPNSSVPQRASLTCFT